MPKRGNGEATNGRYKDGRRVARHNVEIPSNVAARALGHRDPAITLRRHAHVMPNAQELAASAVDGYSLWRVGMPLASQAAGYPTNQA